jgi:hypothetical protein
MQASLSRRDSTFGTNDDFGCNDDIPVGPRVGYTVGSRETTRQRMETSSSSYYTPQLARRFDFLQSRFNIKKQDHKSRARICRPFKAPRNRFPAWRACTTTCTQPYLSYRPATLRYIGWRNRSIGIDFWAP